MFFFILFNKFYLCFDFYYKLILIKKIIKHNRQIIYFVIKYFNLYVSFNIFKFYFYFSLNFLLNYLNFISNVDISHEISAIPFRLEVS
jgi:hypothetical protein